MNPNRPTSPRQDMLRSHTKVALATLSAGISACKDEPASTFTAAEVRDATRRMGEASGVDSRLVHRTPHRYRTGRTAQFNTRIMPATFDRFYQIADQQGWKIGETVEKALEALEEKLRRNAS